MAIHTRVEIDDRLTYGDLYTFVDFARAINTPADSKVIQLPVSEQEPHLGIGSFEIEITSVNGIEQPVTLSATEARSLARLLGSICNDEGDARGALGDLAEWRNRLLGLQADD
jgi:hypothetical protein